MVYLSSIKPPHLVKITTRTSTVSAPISIAVIALILGVPQGDWHLLFRWTNEIIAPDDHVGLGRGEHVCLGALLARLEIGTMYAQLRERLIGMERTGDVVRARSSFVGGIKRAPTRWQIREAR